MYGSPEFDRAARDFTRAYQTADGHYTHGEAAHWLARLTTAYNTDIEKAYEA